MYYKTSWPLLFLLNHYNHKEKYFNYLHKALKLNKSTIPKGICNHGIAIKRIGDNSCKVYFKVQKYFLCLLF